MAGTGGKTDTFANRLKTAISLRDTTAAELSRQTGLSKPKLSQYINGQYEAKQHATYILAKALNVSEAWLMGFDVPIDRMPDEERRTAQKITKELSIEERANQILSGLTDSEGDTLMLDGQAASPEAVEAFKSAIEMGVELARRVNKDKTRGKANNEDNNTGRTNSTRK